MLRIPSDDAIKILENGQSLIQRAATNEFTSMLTSGCVSRVVFRFTLHGLGIEEENNGHRLTFTYAAD